MSETRTAPRATPSALLAGLVAGPIFVAVAAAQMLAREGFDLGRHPMSMLSVGDLGWVQIANFIVGGVLAVAFAVGLRRALRGRGRATTWGPLLIGVYGVGLIAGGVFVPDPALGFPPGAPEGIPAQLSWHAVLHAIAPPLAFLALVIACLVFARRFAGEGARGWAAYSVATAVVAFVLAAPATSVGLFAGVIVGWLWVTALSWRFVREGPVTVADDRR
jgi:Protein of unknown function (DUF998)